MSSRQTLTCHPLSEWFVSNCNWNHMTLIIVPKIYQELQTIFLLLQSCFLFNCACLFDYFSASLFEQPNMNLLDKMTLITRWLGVLGTNVKKPLWQLDFKCIFRGDKNSEVIQIHTRIKGGKTIREIFHIKEFNVEKNSNTKTKETK